MPADTSSNEKNRPLVIIAGPTATGKTFASVELAKRLGGSVISADSMQVYRGMDIGSAKVTEEEMQGIPHYLIDVADPADAWNVVRFQKEAEAAAGQIYAKGRLPFLVGGTGFYIQALLYGSDFTEMDADTECRSAMEEEAKRGGAEELYRRLQEVDPEAAQSIHPNNVKRIIRALEFAQKSGGQRISEHNRNEHLRPPVFDAVFFVFTMDREKLYARIDARVLKMIEDGLEEEARRLIPYEQMPALQTVGYREMFAYFRHSTSLDEAIRLIQRNTRHYAKRQLTWWRRDPDIRWIEP